MKQLERLFFHTKMTWPRVLLFALVCGIVPGVLMLPAALADTSLQQPGITFEFWIFAALLIILNCEKPTEAGIKTFVFFLISQPLIYLVQVPFASMGWQLFSYYPRWGILTLCTLPGGMIAWYCRKDNLPAVLIFSVANFLLCVSLARFVRTTVQHFPHLLLTDLFIIAEITGFILLLFRRRTTRAAAFVLTAGMLLFGFWYELQLPTVL